MKFGYDGFGREGKSGVPREKTSRCLTDDNKLHPYISSTPVLESEKLCRMLKIQNVPKKLRTSCAGGNEFLSITSQTKLQAFKL